MPNVIIKYGPYEAHGIIRHKKQKLLGLLDALYEIGYVVELIPIESLNKLVIYLRNLLIFSCDIRNLQFNTPIESDKLCQQIVDTIKYYQKRISDPNNQPKFQSIDEGYRYIENIKKSTKLQDDKDVSISNISSDMSTDIGATEGHVMFNFNMSNKSITAAPVISAPSVREAPPKLRLLKTTRSNLYRPWFETDFSKDFEVYNELKVIADVKKILDGIQAAEYMNKKSVNGASEKIIHIVQNDPNINKGKNESEAIATNSPAKSSDIIEISETEENQNIDSKLEVKLQVQILDAK